MTSKPLSINQLLRQLIPWRIILFIFSLLGYLTLPFADRFPYRDSILQPLGHPLIYSWASFDGVHYLGIVKNGYFADFTQAFFPVYPLTVRFLDQILHQPLWSGLIISHLFFILYLIFLFKLVHLDHPRLNQHRLLYLILVFPTSFFFISYYTESLFMFMVVASFYYMRTNHPLKAIFFATLASATRVIGVFLIPSLMVEKYLQLKTHHQHPRPQLYLPFLFPLMGLATYMYYLQIKFSDALAFLHAQPAFGAQRSTDKIILLYQVVYRYTKMLLTVDPNSILYYTVNQEFWLSLFFLLLLIISYRRVRQSYFLFAILAYLTPTLTGTFSSMPRYILVLFPCFIVLAQLKHPLLIRLWFALSVILLFINTLLFTRGYWVA